MLSEHTGCFAGFDVYCSYCFSVIYMYIILDLTTLSVTHLQSNLVNSKCYRL